MCLIALLHLLLLMNWTSLPPYKQRSVIFKGVDRRFTFKGYHKQIAIYDDDYGHPSFRDKHTIETARRKIPVSLACFFQPHRYTLYSKLWAEFVDVLVMLT